MQSSQHWVGTWAAAPAPAEGVVGFNNHTKRKSITPAPPEDRVAASR